MKKTTTKILGIGFAITMAVMPLEGTVVHAAGENPVAAQEAVIDTGKCGENATYTITGDLTDGYVLEISGEKELYDYSEVEAPWDDFASNVVEINVEGISTISEYAFEGFERLSKVVLAESVECIQYNAFVNCPNLKDITIPVSVLVIHENAFASLQDSKGVQVGAVEGFVIKGYTGSPAEKYAKEYSLEFVSLGMHPDISGYCGDCAQYYASYGENGGILTISGSGEMYDYGWSEQEKCWIYVPWLYSDIREVNISGISKIGVKSFDDMHSIQKVYIGEGVTQIEAMAFEDCHELTELVLPNSLERIEEYAFLCCRKLTQLNIPNSVTYLGEQAFGGCDSLESVTISKGLSVIPERAFAGCCALRNVVIPSGVVEICDGAFGNCLSLEKVMISSSVTSIADKAIGYYYYTIDQQLHQGKVENLVISGYKGTAAETYAKENGFTFIALDQSTLKTPVLGTVSSTATGVSVSWNAVEGAERYKVFRKVSGENWVTVGTTTGTSIIDTKAVDGTTYTYTVACVNEAGRNVSGFDKTGKTITYKKPASMLATPVLGIVSSTATGVSVSWSAVEGAERYKVFRKVSGENWVTVGTTTGTSIIDTKAVDGTTYTYTVACVNEAGKNVSGFDKTGKTITYKKPVSMLATPVLGTVSSTETGVSVSWNAVEVAERYKVFRKVAGGSWITVGTTTGTSIVDTKAVDGTTYTYTVACVNEAGKNVSGFDKTGKTITYKKPTAMLATPVLGTVSSTSTGVSVSWSAVEGAERYKVFRKVAGENWVTVGTTTGTSIIDTKAVDGTTYTYTVACVNEAGKNVSGFDKTGKTITFKKPIIMLATPVLGTVRSTETGVSVSWNAVEGAERYKVFRKVAGENWVTVGTTTGTSIIDTKAVKGTTYIYTVRCISADGKTNTSDFDHTGVTVTY